ncbi:Lysosome-associated membrane glycoprotein 5 [Triplophysa tibetana]|uniref:Lysosome-associated membrane glycoprotein 5 n=1 Tax=Triplophysa tibetana TaxID=1572043 RepID=A0A5A9NDS5_9TELE|nr:Lysosome-associated membrane glycoprotein 5 [Triplophysa tibetana]
MHERHCGIRLYDKLHEQSDAAASLHFCASFRLLPVRDAARGVSHAHLRLLRLRCAEDLRENWSTRGSLPGFSSARVCAARALSRVSAEAEVENLSGLSPNPDRDIFVVRENGSTCMMAEFAVKFLIPFDVLALNGIDLITEQTSVSIPRGAEIAGKCGARESELHISWVNSAFTFRIFFLKENRMMGSDGNAEESEVWKINKVQLVYDTSDMTHFVNAYNPGKHTASTHRLSALVTPAGRSYVCAAQQTLTLISTDHQKGVTVSMYDIQVQAFDIQSDFIFSEPYKCITDQREQLEQMLPLVLGLILGLIIVITISVYHFHLKLTAQQQPQLPRDRSLYKNM